MALNELFVVPMKFGIRFLDKRNPELDFVFTLAEGDVVVTICSYKARKSIINNNISPFIFFKKS